eukprot:CAMPEP_0183533780 /NCGR_PEP_ID=MMETSP0371-20130417/26422_1 /TAXON_ID=268820 /ORGANISM="Peridinium aciculiferum, Strain PAER-2" /LENGTH=59 /DNA_ID=CAMNT_0025734057 /DNA_START=66 /DNA_END=245 /DNA_ORIENTATION=+
MPVGHAERAGKRAKVSAVLARGIGSGTGALGLFSRQAKPAQATTEAGMHLTMILQFLPG